MKNILFLALTVSLALPQLVKAQCSPVNAQICESGDDTTQVWVNGSYLGKKDYCDQRSGCDESKLCFPIPLDKLSESNVCIAIETTNINPVGVFSSWELEVTCTGGRPFIVNNENPAHAGVSLYWDPSGGGTCGLGSPPPLDAKGNHWTDLNYNLGSNLFTLTGDQVTGPTWTTAQIKNIQTGVVIPFVSYDASGTGSGPQKGCGVLYWRQITKLPVWIPTATPTVYYPPTRIFTSTPTEAPPPIIPTDTPTPRPIPTATPRHRPKLRLLPTPIPTPNIKYVPSPQVRRYKLQPTATFVYRRPTRTPTPIPFIMWKPTPTFIFKKLTPIPTWLPRLDMAHAIVFQTPPVEIYVTFADGPGRYQLELVGTQGNPLRMIFDREIVGEGDAWVTWDGKNEKGQDMSLGQYFVIFYKDGKPLRSISVFRSKTGQ